MRTLGALDFRSNSIGFLRLLFAGIVVWSHAYFIGGFGRDPVERLTGNNVGLGYLAVGGFFVLSGFLITRSFEKLENGRRFLWHRSLRILPGYWACLIITAFGFAGLLYWHQHHEMAGFLSTQAPWAYVINNVALLNRQPTIGSVLNGSPYPVLNGPLWTLAYEFACYLGVAVFGVLGIFRRKPSYVITAGIFFLAIFAILYWRFANPWTMERIDVFGLVAYFAIGSTAYIYRDRIPIRLDLALLCLALVALFLTTRLYALVVPVTLAYLTLFAADRLPMRSFDRNLDLSYGVYIYAFPIQQILALLGANRFGFPAYVLLTATITGAFATGSWFGIERRALALKNASLGGFPAALTRARIMDVQSLEIRSDADG